MKDYLEKLGLNEESTPCDICQAINGIKYTGKKKVFLEGMVDHYSPRAPKCARSLHRGGSVCLDSDRTKIKLDYLLLMKD